MAPTAVATPSVALSSREYTPEDLLLIPDGHPFELVDGKLKNRPMSIESSGVAASLLRLVGNHAHGQKLGKCFGADCVYQMWPDKPNQVCFADASFVSKGRLPGRDARSGHFKFAPDLALEAISPNDNSEETETKRVEYMQAGVKLLWIIYPRNRTVHVYRQDGTSAVLGPKDELSGENVVPGFACKVAELFEDE